MSRTKFKPDTTEQSLLLGYNVEDFLPQNHLARVINAIVDKLDTKVIEKKYSNKGQKSYHPKIIIKVLFYGYSIGIVSSRKIMQGCKQDLGFMYLSKLYKPDYRTISDFRKDNLEILESYFVDILKYCNELGMLNSGVISIDGSKFRANASSKRSKTLKQYKKWEAKLKKEIRELNEKGVNRDEEENNRLNRDTELPKELENKKKLLSKIEEAAKELEKLEKEIGKGGKKLNLTDKDAHFQKERNGVIRTNYNTQVVTNEKQIIVAAEVTTDSSDQKSLQPMIEEAEKNLGKEIKEVKADAGYGSYENYEYIESKKIDGYIPDQQIRRLRKLTKEKKYHLMRKVSLSMIQKKIFIIVLKKKN